MLSDKKYLFEKCIKMNNTITAVISFKNLMNQIIIKPNEQRIKDIDKVDEILNLQDKYCKIHGNFNFLGLINIHCCKEDNKNYLVDGQHRYFAIEKLVKQNYQKNVRIEIVIVDTLEELKFNYAMINKNTELPEFPIEINKQIPEKVAQYFFDEYPNIWKINKKPRRPFMNKTHFQEALGFLTMKLNKSLDCEIDIENLKKLVKDKNDKMGKWPLINYEKNIRKIKKWPEYKKLSDKHGFWLGMYPQTSEKYTYQWIKDIVKEMTGEEIQKKRRYRKKKTIPKKIKELVWKKFIGNGTEGLCFCCRVTKINCLTSYSCGHVIPESNNGPLIIDNLRPICSSCNSSMGTINMEKYIEKNFPDNYYFFKNNVKSSIANNEMFSFM